MITITTEYLNENWKSLCANSVLPIQLFEWDGGDAYIQTSLGVLPSQNIVFASIVFEEKKITDFSIVIRLRKLSDKTDACEYLSPEGCHYSVSAERISNGKSERIEIQVVNLIKELSLRRHDLLETNLLKDSSALIIGLGTGGVQVAIELAKAGIGRLILVDPDRLTAGNVTRHNAGISFVGRKKVLAVKDLILEKNPRAIVDVYPVFADIKNKKILTPLIGNTDLTICATDNRQSKLFVNSLCVDAKKTVIFGGAFRRAYGGQILRVIPNSSACYHCFVLTVPEKEADQEISSERNAEAIAYSDMPVPIEPGLSMDVSPIGTMVSKLALQELIKGKESTLHILDKDFGANWYFWLNRPEPKTDYDSLAPLSESIDEMTILRWYGVYLEKDAGCPTCGDFGRALREQYNLEPGASEPPSYSPIPGINK